MLPTKRSAIALARGARIGVLMILALIAVNTVVRHSATVCEAVKAMHRRVPVTAGSKSSELLAFAQRCRAVRS